MKHTQGEWKLSKPQYQENNSCGHLNCKEHPKQMTGFDLNAGKNNSWIADIHGEHVGVPIRESFANAQLIASAPDLLEACKAVIRLDNDYIKEHECFNMIQQAITKAEGGTK